MSRTRDHYGENSRFLGNIFRSEVWYRAFFGSHNDDPVKLLALTDMSSQKVYTRNVEQRGVLTDLDPSSDCCWVDALRE